MNFDHTFSVSRSEFYSQCCRANPTFTVNSPGTFLFRDQTVAVYLDSDSDSPPFVAGTILTLSNRGSSFTFSLAKLPMFST